MDDTKKKDCNCVEEEKKEEAKSKGNWWKRNWKWFALAGAALAGAAATGACMYNKYGNNTINTNNMLATKGFSYGTGSLMSVKEIEKSVAVIKHSTCSNPNKINVQSVPNIVSSVMQDAVSTTPDTVNMIMPDTVPSMSDTLGSVTSDIIPSLTEPTPRAPHDVNAYFRSLPMGYHASQKQLELAKSMGLNVPSDCTLVSAYKTGCTNV